VIDYIPNESNEEFFVRYWKDRIREKEQEYDLLKQPSLYPLIDQLMNLQIARRLQELTWWLFDRKKGFKQCAVQGGNDGGATYNAWMNLPVGHVDSKEND
jgi:hypothetical protein